ncbi:MAG: hypothetical protein JWP91_1159 [Fibrobacteres bacterium]|nr:hypothetical protein [Fibrobacterota bacterium]
MTSPSVLAKMAVAALLLSAPAWFGAPAWGAAPSLAPDALSGFRHLASALRKSGPGPDTGLVFEYQLNRRSNACTGHEPEIRLRVFANGKLELFRTRSFAESDRFGPGSFQGKAGKAEWDSLFRMAANMEWEDARGGQPRPDGSGSNQVMILNHAGRTARFDLTGPVPPGQESIADGLGAVNALMRPAEADTVWSLGLGASEPKYRKGGLQVRAVWVLRGRIPLRIRLPLPGAQPDCGVFGLRWTQVPKDVQGFTAVPSERNWAYPKASTLGKDAGTWKDLKPGDSLSVSLAFPLPKAKNATRVTREGSLMHPGFPVSLAGYSDTLATVTLFSDYFQF